MRPITTTTSSSLAPTSTIHSSWHSPIPYLFGGLAAMLGLIAFALLILACSYWRLSGQLQDEENSNRDLENNNEKEDNSANKESVKVYEEKILVIMAGDQNPTYLATPVCPKSLFFNDSLGSHSEQNHETKEKTEKEMENHLQEQSNQQ